MPVTWQTLVTYLRKTDLNVLADDIETVLSEHKDSDHEDLWPVMYECTSSFSHYLCAPSHTSCVPSQVISKYFQVNSISLHSTHTFYMKQFVYILTFPHYLLNFGLHLIHKAIFILFHLVNHKFCIHAASSFPHCPHTHSALIHALYAHCIVSQGS